MTPSTHRSSRLEWLLPPLAVAVGVLGMAAVWLAVSLATRTPCGWLAPVAALDIVLMLRLAAAPPGRGRAAAAVLGTGLAITLSYWLVLAAQIGGLLGLRPLESAQRMGPVLAGELLKHGTDAWDLGFALLALALAWRLGR